MVYYRRVLRIPRGQVVPVLQFGFVIQRLGDQAVPESQNYCQGLSDSRSCRSLY